MFGLLLPNGSRTGGSCVVASGVVVTESLAQETSTIAATESAEIRIIDLFMARIVVDAAGQFNRRAPGVDITLLACVRLAATVPASAPSLGDQFAFWRDPVKRKTFRCARR